METIRNYLNNMFANLPRTSQMLKLKNDILSNMEEKYNELKVQGKSENEAIGIVISEFGNIHELIDELGIKVEAGDTLPMVTQEEAEGFIAAKRETGLYVGIGVVLCIMGAALLILISTLADNGIIAQGLRGDLRDMLGLFALFALVIPAVALFIYTGMKMEKYKYLQGAFNISGDVKKYVEQRHDKYASTYMKAIITGVCLCIFASFPLFIASALGNNMESYGLFATLSIVSVGVFIFIYYGNIKESYSMLLKIGDYTKEKVEENKVIGAVAAVVWPLAVCIFIFAGFVYNLWHISWIIFPITGILFGIFSAVYSSIKGHN